MTSLIADIPVLARVWRNHPEIKEWCRQYTLISQAQHENWLKRIEEDPTIKMFGVAEDELSPKGFQTPIGVCGLTSIDRVNQKAEFSLYIAKEYQNRGHGKRALELLCQHGFKDFNLNRIWGEVLEYNPAMQMFQDVGFKIEGTQRQAYFRNGRFIDSMIISRLRTDA